MFTFASWLHSGNIQSIRSSVPVVSRWLWPQNRTFLEVTSMDSSFLRSIIQSRMHDFYAKNHPLYTCITGRLLCTLGHEDCPFVSKKKIGLHNMINVKRYCVLLMSAPIVGLVEGDICCRNSNENSIVDYENWLCGSENSRVMLYSNAFIFCCDWFTLSAWL